MVRLSAETEDRIDILCSPEQRDEMCSILETCSKTNFELQAMNEFDLEPLRFAILKCSDGDVSRARLLAKKAARTPNLIVEQAQFAKSKKGHRLWIPSAKSLQNGFKIKFAMNDGEIVLSVSMAELLPKGVHRPQSSASSHRRFRNTA